MLKGFENLLRLYSSDSVFADKVFDFRCKLRGFRGTEKQL